MKSHWGTLSTQVKQMGFLQSRGYFFDNCPHCRQGGHNSHIWYDRKGTVVYQTLVFGELFCVLETVVLSCTFFFFFWLSLTLSPLISIYLVVKEVM